LLQRILGFSDVAPRYRKDYNGKENGEGRKFPSKRFSKLIIAFVLPQVYYDMGILSSPDVVECSASDLVGQYVGHTGPKTQKLLEKALGKVLFVDEAYRLGEGHFAAEAVNELVDLITKPKFHNKIVIILAGYDNEMNKLMAVNPGLSSRFPEEVSFLPCSSSRELSVLNNIMLLGYLPQHAT